MNKPRLITQDEVTVGAGDYVWALSSRYSQKDPDPELVVYGRVMSFNSNTIAIQEQAVCGGRDDYDYQNVYGTESALFDRRMTMFNEKINGHKIEVDHLQAAISEMQNIYGRKTVKVAPKKNRHVHGTI